MMFGNTFTKLNLLKSRITLFNIQNINPRVFALTTRRQRYLVSTHVNAVFYSTRKAAKEPASLESVTRERFKATLLSSQLKKMKLETQAFKDIFTPELETLKDLFKNYGHELRIAGGAVRDLIAGILPHDIDFATTATPAEMKAMFTAEKIRMIATKGESHGTITCRINDKENFEVTTLRIDVATDGRHAEVAFTKDWELDSMRRDLTINSMFLGLDGTVYDYFNGQEDLLAKRVRFVGSAQDRIREDYLRILRYFRFYGRISEDANVHDPETLAAIRNNVDGLERIAGERIWMEIRKILSGRHVSNIVRVMIECGMAPYIGLPGHCDLDEFEKIWERVKDQEPLPLTLVAALLKTPGEVYQMHDRVKMSKNELKLGLFIIEHRDDHIGNDKFRYCQDLLCDNTGKEPRTKEKILELMKYLGHLKVIPEFEPWELPKYPVNGIALLEAGVPKGPTLAIALQGLRQKWKESRYTMTESELMQFAGEYVPK